jgi:signal recognition particle subunit SRP54
VARGSGTTVQEVNQLLEQFGEMRTMIRQVSSGKGPWAKLARQYAGEAGIPGMPSLPTRAKSSGKKKVGKAARKEKRKHKAKGGKR